MMEEKIYTTETWTKFYDQDGNLVSETHTIFPSDDEAEVDIGCDMNCDECDIFDDIDDDIEIEEEEEYEKEIEVPRWLIAAGITAAGVVAVKLLKRIFR